MKKTLLAILLIALATSQICQSGCTTGGCTNDGGSLPVNSQIIINTPSTIAPPACAIPTINPPVINPPVIGVPVIDAPCINVPTLTGPSVVAPPTITPPTPVIPVIPSPVIPNPSLPPQVPPPTTVPVMPLPPIIPLPVRPPQNCDNQLLSNSFTLSFQYACRQQVAFQSCLGDIVWNNVVIYSIVPTDYLVHTVNLAVTVQVGSNSLQIEGAGISDSYGLTVDNVALVRAGTSVSIVVNGGFEAPDQHGSWSILTDISGWKGINIEIGQGTIYNNGWNSQVCELDGNGNFEISQTFVFDSLFQIVADNGVASCSNPFPGRVLTYKLEFDWAGRTLGINNLDSSKGNVLWNNVVIGSLVVSSANAGINHAVFQVTLNAGSNILQFDGAGLSDSYGISIDNVKLTSVYNTSNLLVNGDFQANVGISAGQFTYINGGINGWVASRAEVGDCRLYNGAWGASQCIELDSDSNQRYTQVITISEAYYAQCLNYISLTVGNSQITNSLNLAINNANNQVANQVNQIHGAISCSIGMTAWSFNSYLQQLYHCADAAVQHVTANQLLEISQYSCAADEWLQYFGESGELDFSCDGYDDQYLSHGWCTIISIQGKVVHCHDESGDYHLQMSPCSHFEGQGPLPRPQDRIFWKGSQGSSGNIHVIVATTCDC